MPKLGFRLKETTVTTGTGAYTLAGAAFGYQAFGDDLSDGDQVWYCCEDLDYDAETGRWEIGIGTWNTGGTLTRTTILASSASGAAINWGSGTRDIYAIPPKDGPMLGADNLDGLSDATASRVALGLGSVATKNEGSGGTLDADMLDGLHESSFVRTDDADTVTAGHTFSGNLTLSGDNTFDGVNDFNQTDSRVVIPVGANKYAT